MQSLIRSARLQLSEFEMRDAEEVFGCITPAISRFMPWEPPRSLVEYKVARERRMCFRSPFDFSFVVRRNDTMECLGLASVEAVNLPMPELGIWLKEAAHGQGYGKEAIRAVAEWASSTFAKASFLYPVAVDNLRSRRIAEALSGKVIDKRTNSKYESVVYEIPRP